MLHNVHLYAVVRVKVCGVDADSHQQAIAHAQDAVDLDALLNQTLIGPQTTEAELRETVTTIEYADEIVGALVDEHGDEEFLNSTAYHQDRSSGELVAQTEREDCDAGASPLP